MRFRNKAPNDKRTTKCRNGKLKNLVSAWEQRFMSISPTSSLITHGATVNAPALPVNKTVEPTASPLVIQDSPSTQVSLGAFENSAPTYRKPSTEITYLRYQQQTGIVAGALSQQLLNEWSMFRNDRAHSFRAGSFLSQVGALSAETSHFRNEARNFSVPGDIAAEKFSPDFSALVGKRRESFLLTIRTKEGDEITVRMTRRQGPGGESLEFAFDVVGELSEAEQQALDKLASKLGEVADEFFRTGKAELRGLAAFDDANIQSFKLELSKPNGDVYDTLNYDYTFDETTQTRRLRGEDVAGYQFDITAHVNGILQTDRATAQQTIEQYLDLIRRAGDARGTESASVRFMLDGLRSVLLLDEFHTGLQDFTASFRAATTYNPENRTQVSAMNLTMGQTTRTETDGARFLLQQESFYELHSSYFKPLPWLEAADFANGNYVYVNEHESGKTTRTLDMGAGDVDSLLIEREKTHDILERFYQNFAEIDRHEDHQKERTLENLVDRLSPTESNEIRQQNLLALIKESRFNLFE